MVLFVPGAQPLSSRVCGVGLYEMQGLLMDLDVSSELTGGVADPPSEFDGLRPRLHLQNWKGFGFLKTVRADAVPAVRPV